MTKQFDEAVELAKYAPDHPINKALLEAKERIAALEACLAGKDAVLELISTSCNFIDPVERAHKALALNPTQYQEKVKARDQVIEAVQNWYNCSSLEEGVIAIGIILKTFTELDHVESATLKGDGK